MESANGGRLLARSGIVLEAVVEGEAWPPYHRRLMQAAVPIWTAAPRRSASWLAQRLSTWTSRWRR